ncbi:hypothetical protein GOODEAATRI_021093 [Goodea atripinnis]|uniref:Uncharacterized protein n=1 Tax=Goodea atripinnis TaxID=208336 RepID=A0ABV0NM07_9TELE
MFPSADSRTHASPWEEASCNQVVLSVNEALRTCYTDGVTSATRAYVSRMSEKDQHEECPHCESILSQEHKLFYETFYNTEPVPFKQTFVGFMVPYFEICEPSASVRYVRQERIISLLGAIHLREVPCNGTWLARELQCEASLNRLRQAALMCVRAPELHSFMLEDKNDYGLLHLTRKLLLRKRNLTQGARLFGLFACDAMLAPGDWLVRNEAVIQVLVALPHTRPKRTHAADGVRSWARCILAHCIVFHKYDSESMREHKALDVGCCSDTVHLQSHTRTLQKCSTRKGRVFNQRHGVKYAKLGVGLDNTKRRVTREAMTCPRRVRRMKFLFFNVVVSGRDLTS